MRFIHLTRTARNAKAILALTVLSALVAFGAMSQLSLTASTSKPGFKLAATPASQTVTQGHAATYSIAISRDNKFTSPVTLSVTGLPSGASPVLSPNPVPGSGSVASLTVTTSSSTAPGTYPLTITGDGGRGSVGTSATLVVRAAAQPNFTLTGSPASRVISDEDSASYTIAIARNDFSGPIALSTGGVPNDLSAQVSPSSASGDSATLTVTSGVKPKPGTYTLTITGAGGGMTRSTAVTLTVEEKKPFQIAGAGPSGLAPGESESVDLVLTNPHNFPLVVTDLTVSVDEHTGAPGCSGSENFSVAEIPGSAYPIHLPALSSRTLSQLGAPQPEVGLIDDPITNQDACKGVSFDLHYSGLATR